jgi:succinate dehydrogenase/fumarate reductase flavoprotein subunit
MEEKYGERGNLMPRDVISREMAMLGRQAYLDLTGLDEKTWKVKLSDLRQEVQHYLGIDPASEPVPVSPGIHYFMGGILINDQTQVVKEDGSVIDGLYAAGEVTGGFHGTFRVDGSGLGDSFVFGRIAGRETAAAVAAE